MLLTLLGCTGSSNDVLDGRFVAETYIWTCLEDRDENRPFAGVPYQRFTMQWAPDAIEDLPLPQDCERMVDMRPSTGTTGDMGDLPTSLAWKNDVLTGQMAREVDGFWSWEKEHLSCHEPLGMAVAEITTESPVQGLVAPTPGTTDIGYTGKPDDGLAFGEEFSLSWQSSDWDAAWVTIDRWKRGDIWETVTCNLGDSTEISIDAAIWDYLELELKVDANEAFVTLMYNDVVELDGGDKVEVQTRMTVNPSTYR